MHFFAFEKVGKLSGNLPTRHTIELIEFILDEDIPRFKGRGIIVTIIHHSSQSAFKLLIPQRNNRRTPAPVASEK